MRLDPRVQRVVRETKENLRQIFKASGLNMNELAGLIGGNAGSVHWAMTSDSAPQVDTLAMFAHAMGYEVVITFRRRK